MDWVGRVKKGWRREEHWPWVTVFSIHPPGKVLQLVAECIAIICPYPVNAVVAKCCMALVNFCCKNLIFPVSLRRVNFIVVSKDMECAKRALLPWMSWKSQTSWDSLAKMLYLVLNYFPWYFLNFQKKKGLYPLYLVWLYPSTLINRAINRFDLADYISLFNSLASVSWKPWQENENEVSE